MSGFIEGESRHLSTELPERVNDYVEEDASFVSLMCLSIGRDLRVRLQHGICGKSDQISFVIPNIQL